MASGTPASIAVERPPLREKNRLVEADVRKAGDNHGGDLERRRLAREIKLGALLGATGEERGAIIAAMAAGDAFRARRGTQQPDRLPCLGEEVEALVLGDAGPMASAELIIFPHFDVVSGAVTELRPTADQEVVLPPDVAGLQEAELQAAAT